MKRLERPTAGIVWRRVWTGGPDRAAGQPVSDPRSGAQLSKVAPEERDGEERAVDFDPISTNRRREEENLWHFRLAARSRPPFACR